MNNVLKQEEGRQGSPVNPYKIERISASMIGSYVSCPLSFYYGYIAKLKLEQTSIHLSFGSAVHKALEEFHKGDPNYVQHYIDMFKRDELDDQGKAMFSEYYPLGLEMIKNMVASYPQLDKVYGLFPGTTEQYFRRDIVNPMTGEKLRIPVSGVTDLVTDSKCIIDYKTSKHMWNMKDEGTAAKVKIQSHIYNLWYYAQYGELAEKTLYFIMLKKYKQTAREEVIQILEHTPTMEELGAAFEEVDLIIDKIEAGIFDRPQKKHPRWCDCYKYEKLLNIQ
jgi:hypothetical protein